MNHATLVQLLADLGARIESAQRTSEMPAGLPHRANVLVILDATTADTFRESIESALADLSRIRRIPVDIERTDLVDSHDTPSGLPVAATIHGPHELGRALPGAAVLEITGPPAPRKS